MGTISMNNGLFSGLPTQEIINALIQAASGSRTLAQQRLVQIQSQQAAVLDLNSRVNALRTAAQGFRTKDVFGTKAATSSNEDILSARATNAAQPGTYRFIVDRLVTTQQMLTGGFADRDRSSVGATAFTFESELARIDRSTRLADLNGGEGIQRGTLTISDGTNSRKVDLSRVATLDEVVDAINAVEDLNVTARVKEGRLVLEGAASLTDSTGGATLGSLGLANKTPSGGAITGDRLLTIGASTALTALNDGTGVDIHDDAGPARFDFVIKVDGTDVRVNIGTVYADEDTDGDGQVESVVKAGPASTVGQVVGRINSALAAAGFADVEASINAETGGIDLAGGGHALEVRERERNSGENGEVVAVRTTARDLGLLGLSGSGTLSGRRLVADANTTLVSSLNGGKGLMDAADVEVQMGDGHDFSVDVSSATTVEQLLSLLNDDPDNGGRVRFELNDLGTGIRAVDLTGGADGPMLIMGDAAEALGVAGEADDDGTIGGASLQMRYIAEGTSLKSLNDGAGIGSGTLRIRDANGTTKEIIVGSALQSVGDLLKTINNQRGDLKIEARINANGDGIEIVDTTNGAGAVKLKVEDIKGTVGAAMRIAGEAKAIGAGNRLDGTFERRVEFSPDDTLDEIVSKINQAGAGVAASVINDGSGSTPYRLNLVSTEAGEAGRFLLDTGGLDLKLRTIDRGENARVFFGSANAAEAVLIETSSSSVDGVVPGLTVDLKRVSEGVETVTVTNDVSAIETELEAFVKTFNDAIARIDHQTRYVQDTEERGPLLGDGTSQSLRRALFNAISAPPFGFTGPLDSFADIGISVAQGGASIEFDAQKFREAYEQDPQAVEDLLVRRDIDTTGGRVDLGDGVTAYDPDAPTTFSALGLISQLEQLADRYVNSLDGTLTRKKKSLDDQISAQQSRIESMTSALERKREILDRQFAAMESAIANLQSQQSSLLQLSQLTG